MMLTDEESAIWDKIIEITDVEDELTQEEIEEVERLSEGLPDLARAWVFESPIYNRHFG